MVEIPCNFSMAVAYADEDMSLELPPIAPAGSATVQVAYPRGAVVCEKNRVFMPWKPPRGAGSDQVWRGALTGLVYTTQATWLAQATSVLVVLHYVSHQVQMQVSGGGFPVGDRGPADIVPLRVFLSEVPQAADLRRCSGPVTEPSNDHDDYGPVHPTIEHSATVPPV